MTRTIMGVAAAALMALTIGGAAQSQERILRRATAGEPAMLNKSMTQSQARRLCQQQFRGARESKSAIRQKMALCQRKYMEGM